MLNFSDLVHGDWLRLRHVVRFNRYPRIKDESVAEHSYFVTLFAVIIARDLETQGVKVNYRTLMSRCVMHDVEETVLGDLDGPLKKKSPEIREQLNNIGHDVVSSMIYKASADRNLVGDWQFAKNFDVEGDIVRLADLLSVVQYVASEISLGNYSILESTTNLLSWVDETWNGVKKTSHFTRYLNELRQVITKLYEDC